MINTNRIQNLDDSITRLIAAYQQAMTESDKSDFVTKAEVTRSIIDSGRALANRLRTREQGTDALVQKLENYYQALHAEDWVEKSKSAITKATSIMGFTTAVIVAVVFDFLRGIFDAGVDFGSNFFRYLILYPAAIITMLRLIGSAYEEFSKVNTAPSMASIILSRTVDPVEQQVYGLIGGNRPLRTFETVKLGGAIGIGVIVFVFACGIVSLVLRAL